MGFPGERSRLFTVPEVLNLGPKILDRFTGAGREAEELPPPSSNQGRYLGGQNVHDRLGPFEAGAVIALVAQRLRRAVGTTGDRGLCASLPVGHPGVSGVVSVWLPSDIGIQRGRFGPAVLFGGGTRVKIGHARDTPNQEGVPAGDEGVAETFCGAASGAAAGLAGALVFGFSDEAVAS
jgi:hypothetical protein